MNEPTQLGVGQNLLLNQLVAQLWTMGVSVKPGWITPQRTPWNMASIMSVRAAPSRPALVAA